MFKCKMSARPKLKKCYRRCGVCKNSLHNAALLTDSLFASKTNKMSPINVQTETEQEIRRKGSHVCTKQPSPGVSGPLLLESVCRTTSVCQPWW